MNKFFILAFGLVSLASTAQKTIVDEKFIDGENPVGYRFKKSTIYISKGEQIKLRSNSAKAAKTWKTNLPIAVAVSISSSKLFKATPSVLR